MSPAGPQPLLRSRLPGDVVLDGELVIWDAAAGRLDFAALSPDASSPGGGSPR